MEGLWSSGGVDIASRCAVYVCGGFTSNVVLCIGWSIDVVYIYRLVRVGIYKMTVGVYDCRGCVFCRLVCLGARGGLYSVVRTYVGGCRV